VQRRCAGGEAVVAIGNPLGYDFSVTSGTDAAINEGDSGGPLIDASGHVIGISEQITSQPGGNQGPGFAVPINTAVSAMKQQQATGKVTYAYLGARGQTITSDIAGALGCRRTRALMKHKPSDTVTLTVVRDGKSRDENVTLAERPRSS